MALLLVVSLSIAEQSFSEQYERGYNFFNPASQYAPDNPFNPANRSRGHLEEKSKSAESLVLSAVRKS
jgi:hypothetical protein